MPATQTQAPSTVRETCRTVLLSCGTGSGAAGLPALPPAPGPVIWVSAVTVEAGRLTGYTGVSTVTAGWGSGNWKGKSSRRASSSQRK